MHEEIELSSAFVRKVKLKKRTAWRGVLKYNKYRYEDDDEAQSDDVQRDHAKGKQKRTLIDSWQETKMFDVSTKGDAIDELAAWKKSKTTPALLSTVSEYSRAFIDGLKAANAVQPSTLKGYEGTQKRIEAEFSRIKFVDLKTQQVEQWRNKLVASGLSAVSVRKHIGFLDYVYKHAVKSNEASWNPCSAVKLPEKSQVEPPTLEPAMVKKLFEKLSGCELTPLVVSAYISAYTGMRLGEICGLRWSDVDLENRTIKVGQSIGVGPGGTYVKDPKTESSKRKMGIHDDLVEVLSRRQAAQYAEWVEMRMKIEAPKTMAEFAKLYVTGTIDGRYANPTVISKRWASFAENNEINDSKGKRATFHVLRHFVASLLIAEGNDAVATSKQLGHAQPSTTMNVYANSFEERKLAIGRSIGDSINTIIAEPKPAEVIMLDRASNE